MCGICGVFEFGRAHGEVSETLLTAMSDVIVHRGPDSGGTYISPDRRLGLGFRRLAIVDLSSAGNQPMTNEDGSVWLVFNGEIYNHRVWRQQMLEKGHVYRSEADTETILHLYEDRGREFVHCLHGMFGIALWDSVKEELTLVRDRIGVKPVYYTVADGRLIFGSEIKAILEHPAVVRDVDETALYHYLTFFTTPAPQTLFKGIRKLPPGHMLICDRKGNIRIERYWDAIVETPKEALTEAEIIPRLRDLLTQSIEKRMMSDVPFGVFLSGGVDSSANVALMSACSTEPVRTFTIGFKGIETYNELEYARQIARHFGTDHHEILIGPDEVLSFLPDLIFHQDEPIADPVCVPLYYVSKLVRDSGTIVVQVGEGSDEIFCGYPNYVDFLKIHERGWSHLERLPRGVRSGLAAAAAPFSQFAAETFMPRGKKLIPDLVRRLGANEELFWGGTVVYDEVSKSRLLSKELRDRLGRISSHDVVSGLVDHFDSKKPDGDFLERMIYLELNLRLAELLLMRVDKITMATSVEARVPFLDHEFVEFAMTIPRHLKYKNGQTKYILKKALEGILPDNIIYRKKQGFGLPIKEWFMDGFGQELDQRILNSRLRKRNYFNYGEIEQMLAAHKAGKIDYSFNLWGLLNLSLWYERWIEPA
ncbi:MAG: asparagine synthase (glutamine-hydrolyzing) [Acidobacteria bacterium]|nr:asparagine synthase (glutamine-hydrolyzing) [Acidobacteriota bacterium]